MAICTPMGPGFFLFFQTCDDRAGGYKQVFTYPRDRICKFEYKDEEEKKAAPILEAIDQTEGIDTQADLELILRLRLRQQGLLYKTLYLAWLNEEFERKKALKRRKKAITFLLLH